MMKVSLAALAGGVAAMLIGTLWYMSLSNPWMEAAGLTLTQIEANPSPTPYLISFLAWIVTAWALGLLIRRQASLSWRTHLQTVGLAWLAFGFLSTVLTTFYGMRGLNLLWIDAGYTLLSAFAIAAIHKLIVAPNR